MADRSNKDEAQKQFAKLQRAEDGKKAMSEYEAEAAAVRAKTARLRALRLAHEAEQAAAAPAPAAAKKKKAAKGDKPDKATKGTKGCSCRTAYCSGACQTAEVSLPGIAVRPPKHAAGMDPRSIKRGRYSRHRGDIAAPWSAWHKG